MNLKIAAATLALFPVLAFSQPSLVVTPKLQGNQLTVSTEFLADPANPVAALIYEVKMDTAGRGYSKAAINTSSCVSGLPAGFSGLCNPATKDGAVRVVIYSSDPTKGLPSGTIGQFTLPASAVKLAREGEIELGFVEFTSTSAQVIQGETLVDVEPGLRVNSRSGNARAKKAD